MRDVSLVYWCSNKEKNLSPVEEIITLQKTPISSIREEGEAPSERANLQNWAPASGFLLTSAKQRRHASCTCIFEGKYDGMRSLVIRVATDE
jgi:ATP-dependent DNA ligase